MTAPNAAARYVGQQVKRREDPRLLSGHGQYVDDVMLAHAVHAVFVRSNVARGTITRLDTTAAAALDGVHAVYTGADLNPMAVAMWCTLLGPPAEHGGETAYPPLRPLADGDVRMVGDPIAIILAENRYVAEDAAELVEVDIDAQTPILNMRTAANSTEGLVHRETNSNVAAEMTVAPDPAVDEAFASAHHVVTRTFRQSRATNAPMEPRGVVARYDTSQRRLEIWSSTQSVYEAKSYAARLVGLPEHHVRVIAGDVGGAFGQKLAQSRDEAAVYLAAVRFGNRPVKWIEDRRENLVCANQAREEEMDVSMAVDADGRILALRAHMWEDCGAWPTAGSGSVAFLSAMMLPGPYRIPKVEFGATAVYMNTCGKSAYRGPWMMETTAREQLMDHVAREIGLDPVEIRRRNLIRSDDLPYQTPTGMTYDVVTPAECFESALEILDVDRFRREQQAARDQGRLLGMGVSVYIEPSSMKFSIGSTEQANLRMDLTGNVFVTTGSGNHGQSLETTVAQVVADYLGCELDAVICADGDTDSAPIGVGTGGSRSAVYLSGAARLGALMLRERLVAMAAHLMEASPDDLEIEAGRVSVRGTPSRSKTFAEIANVAYKTPDEFPPGVDSTLEVVARYCPEEAVVFSNAAHVCTVEVDAATGLVRILRYIVAEDCGTMINPMVVEGQIAGGVAQGIGGALLEHMVYDDDGNPLTSTMMDYLLPTACDVPDIEYGHIETPSTVPGGFKGMGEGGAIAAPAAVANAIHDAVAHLGVHPTSIPLGPSDILHLLHNP